MDVEAEEYGEWRVTFSPDVRGGMVCHKHPYSYTPDGQDINPLVYAIDSKGRCRKCGAECPKGVLFRAKTSVLEGLTDEG